MKIRTPPSPTNSKCIPTFSYLHMGKHVKYLEEMIFTMNTTKVSMHGRIITIIMFTGAKACGQLVQLTF